jgi:hypothetical protein
VHVVDLSVCRRCNEPARTLKGPANAALATPALGADGNLYVEADSPGAPVRTIERYVQGTRMSYAGSLFVGIGRP